MDDYSKNPWKTLSTRKVYQNPWITVREDKVITPAGTDGIYGVVESKPAIGIVPITEDLDTYLVGQYRYPLDTWTWEIPEGGGNPGENVLDGAKRELKEETGLTAEHWTSLGELFTSNCFTDEVGYCFLAESLTQGEAMPDDTEQLIIKKVSLFEAWQMVIDYEIKDALSIIGLMRARQWLDRKIK